MVSADHINPELDKEIQSVAYQCADFVGTQRLGQTYIRFLTFKYDNERQAKKVAQHLQERTSVELITYGVDEETLKDVGPEQKVDNDELTVKITAEQAQRLIDSQQQTIKSLTKRLRRIHVNTKYLQRHQVYLPNVLLKPLLDIAGEQELSDGGFSDRQSLVERLVTNHDQKKVALFGGDPFPLWVLLRTERSNVSQYLPNNIIHEINEIEKLSRPLLGEPDTPDYFSSNDEFNKD